MLTWPIKRNRRRRRQVLQGNSKDFIRVNSLHHRNPDSINRLDIRVRLLRALRLDMVSTGLLCRLREVLEDHRLLLRDIILLKVNLGISSLLIIVLSRRILRVGRLQ